MLCYEKACTKLLFLLKIRKHTAVFFVFYYFFFNFAAKNYIHLAMELHFTGVIIAVSTFLIIGIFHPVVIKTEYYTGTRYWWAFLILGLIAIGAAFLVTDVLLSAILGVTGASFLWSIGELFDQRKRVLKGWFPMNPKRKHEYEEQKGNEKEG